MKIQIKKAKDAKATLACVRDDGTRTWSKVQAFFPVHDLTHCAVESVLGFDRAFFGMIAAGDTIDQFAERGMAARMPDEALWAESIVGLLDMERGSGETLGADEFNETLGRKQAGYQRAAFRPITEAELGAMRELRDAMALKWYGTAQGDTFEVDFPATLDAVLK